ncbi:MAG TPA: IPT/TIG domain-containing protein [Bryobacteraceae bacterium]|nr:IPT/TIG domain-containing protein [Bryobacteraceae bacterium]
MKKYLVVLLLWLGYGIAAQAATTIWAGTSVGPYKSVDGGATWQFVPVATSNPLIQGNPNVLAIALDPKQPSTVYLVGNAGALAFFTSTDNGDTWSAVTLIGVVAGTGNTWLVIDPVQTNVMYLGSGAKLHKSTNSGATWTLVANLPNLPASTGNQAASVLGLSVDPNMSGTVYLTAGPLFIDKSTDFGATWQSLTRVTQSFVSPSLASVIVDPKNSNVLYIANGYPYVSGDCGTSATTEQDCGLFRSADGGHTWANVGPPGVYRNVVFDSKTSDVYAAANITGIGSGVLKSSDGGSTWNPINNTIPALILAADPTAGASLFGFVGYPSTYQVYRSTNGGVNWTSVSLPDQNNTTPHIVGLALPAAAAVTPPAPIISENGVVNGASYQPGVVPNSWVTILGTGLASKTDDWTNSIVNGQFPISVDGVSVTIGGKPAYISYISPGQINLLTPDLGFGPLPLTVTTAGGTSATFTVTSSQFGPAFFAWPNGQPVATRQDFSWAVKNGTFPGAATVSAKPGEVIILWGTGFGPTNPIAPFGVLIPSDTQYSTTTLPEVKINNTPVTVYGAALAPGFGGLYQIAIQIPSSIADGDWPIQASIGGIQSPGGMVLSVKQ